MLVLIAVKDTILYMLQPRNPWVCGLQCILEQFQIKWPLLSFIEKKKTREPYSKINATNSINCFF